MAAGVIAVMVFGGILAGCGQKKLDPPVAMIEPKVDSMFDTVLVDNYYWLRDRTDQKVLDYLTAENEYAVAMTEHTGKLQDKLYDEMVGRIKETDLSVPVQVGEWEYYVKDDSGKQYKIYCRKPAGGGDEQVLLDVNQLAEGHEYMLVAGFEISPDHSMLAYAFDTKGREEYTVQFKNLTTGDVLKDEIVNTDGDIQWANDNQTIFYVTQDAETLRPERVWRYRIGEGGTGTEVYYEPDGKFYVGLGRSRSGQFIFINLGSAITTEIRYLDANKPNGTFRVVAARETGVEYDVSHHGNDFYIVTNADSANNFKLVTAPVKEPDRKNWKEIVSNRVDVMLSGVDVFRDFMVVYERENGLQTMRVQNMSSGEAFPITFDEPAYSYSIGGGLLANHDFNATKLRFSYESMVTPPTVYDYDMVSRTKAMRKQKEIPGGYDPGAYQSERVMAKAGDGTMVPVSLVYKKALFTHDGSNPMYLYGYGSYGADMDPWFSTSRPTLLDRGFIFAIAHIRGGGEMGRMWKENGKFLHKKNTFTDFIDCADYLVAQKYTSHEKLVISGGSAGGLLIGAVVNMRPDVCNVAVADVPFVDVINTMLDASIPLTEIEWEEWGNPHEEKFFHYMLSYSPYDNVKAQDYPNMLITAGLNDPRVQYWEPAKWTAKLRATKTDNNDLLFKTVMEGGHFGQSGRYSRIRELAFEYAFILDKMKIAN
jgi:oligopeptidase B